MKINFPIAENIIAASHITGIYDVNRSTTLPNDDFSLVAEWAQSVADLKLQGIIFHNNFSAKTCKAHQSDYIHFVKVNYYTKYNPNVFRYAVYFKFLSLHAHLIKNIFFTDVSDVVVLKNPFLQELYLENSNTIFCGDEPKILANEWMQEHSSHLRSKIATYTKYEEDFKNEVLLNCGIIGGSIDIISHFIAQLWSIHRKNNADNKTPYTGDMGAFNYLVRTNYQNKVIHGKPVNTEFKSFTSDDLCWFKHK